MDSTAFKKQMEVGKKFERKVQTLLETHSPGQVFRNVRVGSLCEFDAIVADYPLMTFVEIKRYRSDLRPSRVKKAVIKLQSDCKTIVNSTKRWPCTWIPYRNKRNEVEKGEVTKMELLLNKLNIKTTEGWRFRMMLIVPNDSYHTVLSALHSNFRENKESYPNNLVEIEGTPLIVLRNSAIEETFW